MFQLWQVHCKVYACAKVVTGPQQCIRLCESSDRPAARYMLVRKLWLVHSKVYACAKCFTDFNLYEHGLNLSISYQKVPIIHKASTPECRCVISWVAAQSVRWPGIPNDLSMRCLVPNDLSMRCLVPNDLCFPSQISIFISC